MPVSGCDRRLSPVLTSQKRLQQNTWSVCSSPVCICCCHRLRETETEQGTLWFSSNKVFEPETLSKKNSVKQESKELVTRENNQQQQPRDKRGSECQSARTRGAHVPTYLNLCDPHGLYSPWNSPGQNAGVSSLSLLLEIFPSQGCSSSCDPVTLKNPRVRIIGMLT